MATSIITGVATTGTEATGRSYQGHLIYAVNQGAWWVFSLSSTNQISARYSSDGTSWSTPTNSPFTLAGAHNSEALNYAFAYKNISSTDVLHLCAGRRSGTSNYTATTSHARFTLGTTWTTSNAEASTGTAHDNWQAGDTPGYAAIAAAIDTNNRPVDQSSYWYIGGVDRGNMELGRASNTDSGTSWTAGFGTPVNVQSVSHTATAGANFALAGGNVLAMTDDTETVTEQFQNIYWSKWTSSWSAAASVLSSNVTSTNVQNWGACALSTSDIHVVALSNNSNTFVHRRYNGTSWANGNTPNTLAYGSLSGLAMVSDGTYVWLFACDTSKNIQYSKWTSGVGWSSWAVLEATRTNAPRYLCAAIKSDNSAIQIIWTETNGGNFEIWTSQLSLVVPNVWVPPTCLMIPTFQPYQFSE